MPQCQILLHAGVLVTQNDRRDIFHDYTLAIRDGIIAGIGPTAEMQGQWQAGRELDLKQAIVLPGLINAHCHAAMTFLRGMADDLPLMTWLEQAVFPVEARLRKDITRMGALLGYAEMLACGITACIDMYIFEDAVFEAARTAGIRCMGGEAVFNFPSAACASWQDALARTRELAQHYADNPRITVAVNPHSVYTTTPEILAACRDLALEQNLAMHIHLAETEKETELCLDQHGLRPIAYCANLGLFDCRVIAAHLVDVKPEEAELLARKNVCGVHNPSSNMKLASGVSPVDMMLARGMKLGLGTDGPASNNNLNIFNEMSRAALLHKLVLHNPEALPAPAVLDMATRGGAAAFADMGLGSLTPGAKADCIALDMNRPNMLPLHNPVSQLVYAASGHECILTMVAGEILYENGKFCRFDYDDILREALLLRDFALGKDQAQSGTIKNF